MLGFVVFTKLIDKTSTLDLFSTWIRSNASMFDILTLTPMFYNDFIKVKYGFNPGLSDS